MDDTEDDARYPPNPYSSNHHQNYLSSHRPKLPVRNASYAQPIGNEYGEEDEDEEVGEEEELGEEEDEDEDEDEEEENGGQMVVAEDREDEDEDDAEDGEDEDGGRGGNFYSRKEADDDSEGYRKKRKLKNLSFGYEFAPRAVAAPPSNGPTASAPKPSFGGRNSPADWTEHSTFVLLDAWGERFLQLGRKSLRSDEWHEVAKKVSQVSNTVRTDTQCRNRLDTLKKKYKKEKMMFAEKGETSSKWVYFKKMDMLLTSSSSSRQPGLSCGLDSGEYVFMNPKSYLNRCNGLDEMRDSPDSQSSEGNDDDSDGLPPKRTRSVETDHRRSSFRLLADSIQKFGEIYEKIENGKRQQMVELEKMRMDFQREMELQKRQIMERAHAEIAKIRQGDDEEIDVSTENTSG